MKNNQSSFFGLGIAPGLLKKIADLRFTKPTPIQLKAIPVGVAGEDLIGVAQTGTGKTLAFAVPLIQRIAARKCTGLIVLPTRELALQVDEALRKLGGSLNLRTAVLIGGASMSLQLNMIRRRPHVIVATPGRLNDHLEQKTVSLARVGVLVLDEADRMLDMGFAPQIKRILQHVPKDRQTMLFSATIPVEIERMARVYMRKPLRVEVAPSGTAPALVDQEVFILDRSEKLALLEKLLNEYHGTVLIFSRTKYGAKKIARSLRNMGHNAAEIHSNRSFGQRREAMDGFKSGKYRILVATDIASRGIDVVGIELVVNYDLPDKSEDYVHRIGRTGRAGIVGKAISFANPEQERDILAIERLIRTRLAVKPRPDLPHRRSTAVRRGITRAESGPAKPYRRRMRRGFARRPQRSGYSRRGRR